MSQPSRLSRTSAPNSESASSAQRYGVAKRADIGALVVLSGSHLVNDALQSLLIALYPLLKATFAVDYVQIGLISLVYQVAASVPQPWLGHCNDKKSTPALLCLAFSLESVGLLILATASGYGFVLIAAVLIGFASSVFHPIASPIVQDASGGRHGLAQSVFQIGGNAGASLGPLLAAFLILPHGLSSVSWLCLPTVVALAFCFRLATQRGISPTLGFRNSPQDQSSARTAPGRTVAYTLAILLVLMFSKYFYLTGMGTFYTFYLIHRFDLTARTSQIYLFAFLVAIAAGTLIGGPVVDRVGEKPVIVASIVGVAPFTIALPYLSLGSACNFSIIIGLILASAFPAILVFAQKLLPDRVGLISGFFFGIAFGFGGLGSVLLGILADHFGVIRAFQVNSYLPLLGIAALLLPSSAISNALPG